MSLSLPRLFARRQTALSQLLADLWRLEAEGNQVAANFAGEIRQDGNAARRLLVTNVVPLIAQSPSAYAHDPVARAFCRWHEAQSGVDLLKAPEGPVRARMAQDAARRAVEDARARRANASHAASLRRHEQNLAVIAASARRSSR